jgi:hypothetical protein
VRTLLPVFFLLSAVGAAVAGDVDDLQDVGGRPVLDEVQQVEILGPVVVQQRLADHAEVDIADEDARVGDPTYKDYASPRNATPIKERTCGIVL